MTKSVGGDGLSEADLDPDPFKQFAKWYGDAVSAGGILPEAMALATASQDGRPSVRMVLLKGFDARGFVFYSNYESQKAKELDENPHASLAFYWAALGRQVRIGGRVTKVLSEASAAYFRTRPLESQLSAWASRQSEVIPNRGVLEGKVAELGARYRGREVPLPPFWGGYRLSPESIEFWHHRDNRLHDRLHYLRLPDGAWRIERLAP